MYRVFYSRDMNIPGLHKSADGEDGGRMVGGGTAVCISRVYGGDPRARIRVDNKTELIRATYSPAAVERFPLTENHALSACRRNVQPIDESYSFVLRNVVNVIFASSENLFAVRWTRF